MASVNRMKCSDRNSEKVNEYNGGKGKSVQQPKTCDFKSKQKDVKSVYNYSAAKV